MTKMKTIYTGIDQYGAHRCFAFKDGLLMGFERWSPYEKRRWKLMDWGFVWRAIRQSPDLVKERRIREAMNRPGRLSYLEFAIILDEIQAETRD